MIEGFAGEGKRDRAPNPWPSPNSNNFNRKSGKETRHTATRALRSSQSNQKTSSRNQLALPKPRSADNANATRELKKSLGLIPHQKPTPLLLEYKDSRNETKSISTATSLQSITSINSKKSCQRDKDVKTKDNNSKSSYYGAYSYGKKIPSLCDSLFTDSPSPRGLTRNGETARKPIKNSPLASINKPNCENKKIEKPAEVTQKTQLQVFEPVEVYPDIIKIETRRTIVREGGIHFEETSVIQFPKNLPSNVQVVTAQFVPSNRPE
ncbi:hypothetical protein L5515_003947 [Caenorhabditis briggsae]|uniref:Uncharacterized protein n=1 Tax=Caenorhabditis briggsae TaxID=6238 RepID=A0AAE9EKR2_CAEBR|nr:hypothetical protein L5515_003947 [Caenorhabditis briggsae]